MKTIVAALLIVGTVHAGEAPVLELKLSVKSQDGRPVVHIALANHSAQTLKVLHALADEEEMYGKLFELHDAASGQPLEYQGIMVKRGPLTEEDYLAMAPGAKRRNAIDLGRAYAFKPGRHAYTISYCGHYLRDGKEVPLTVGPVRFEHTGR
ncbi:hypothetical protein GTP41_17765 [Pseudoduganella sp. DS3]|uniref:Uncharacterized protein n=1 Tax=Pseudoduganella guangdongensis TaxID=2692179 RepID=A0A6N9HML9_9BURK|nr:hypothetical protein [Pseudoduganella guangdongensis]MYN03945.1 hypothetical protein [Pseudoduganella guangdongensis]